MSSLTQTTIKLFYADLISVYHYILIYMYVQSVMKSKTHGTTTNYRA